MYSGCKDGTVFALDGGTGAVKWRYSTGEYYIPAPAIGRNGVLYVTAETDYLYAFE